MCELIVILATDIAIYKAKATKNTIFSLWSEYGFLIKCGKFVPAVSLQGIGYSTSQTIHTKCILAYSISDMKIFISQQVVIL